MIEKPSCFGYEYFDGKIMARTIHPFPARMAPELALASLADISPGSIVLDPMAGSGTVIRQAAEMGHRPIGFDMDPLAVLMSKVWTKSVDDEVISRVGKSILDIARDLNGREIYIPWIDESVETKKFIDYWFGNKQQLDLRKIAYVLSKFSERRFSREKHAAIDVVRVALSRIIVTKEQCASLARDTSHSRPHRVTVTSDYDIFNGLERSIIQVRKRLKENPPIGNSAIELGDARSLVGLKDKSVDAVLTSPPYLNAIDYLRGHRMSLVWLGHRIEDLRGIRSDSIGAERAPDFPDTQNLFEPIRRAMCNFDDIDIKIRPMIDRYSKDVFQMIAEIARVTKPGGLATFVVGNSCIKGQFIQNSEGVATAAIIQGFKIIKKFERNLPSQSRYLPMTNDGSLGKRMRTETIIVLERK